MANTWFEWKSALTHRISGNIHGGSPGNIIDVAIELKKFRGNPFYGIMNIHGTDMWNALGILGWILLLPLCWILYNKKSLPLDVLCGFLLAGILVSGWFITFEQHTIIHAGSTGRLVSLFAGLGMSAALTMIWILKASHAVDKGPSNAQKQF